MSQHCGPRASVPPTAPALPQEPQSLGPLPVQSQEPLALPVDRQPRKPPAFKFCKYSGSPSSPNPIALSPGCHSLSGPRLDHDSETLLGSPHGTQVLHSLGSSLRTTVPGSHRAPPQPAPHAPDGRASSPPAIQGPRSRPGVCWRLTAALQGTRGPAGQWARLPRLGPRSRPARGREQDGGVVRLPPGKGYPERGRAPQWNEVF